MSINMNVRHVSLLTLVVSIYLPLLAVAKEFCFVPEGVDGTFAKKICIDSDTNDITSVQSLPDDSFAPSLYVDVNNLWLIITGALVFFMQTGFAMLEAGAVRQKNVSNIIFKNLMDSCIGGFAFWLLGYGFAYGDDNDGLFIGAANFALSDETGSTFAMFFFQFTFTATAATIVSGSVAERCKIETYFIYTFVLSAFIYPVVVHWVWDAQGWLTGFGNSPIFSGDKATSTGMIDFAGSGVVHVVGGFAGLIGAIAVGPRIGRFDEQGKPVYFPGHNILLQSLGTVILWFGWIGFNSGSTLSIAAGNSTLAGKVAAVTTISACSGGLTGAITGHVLYRTYDLNMILNSILAALVSITAGCAVVGVGSAAIIGCIGSLVYVSASRSLLRMGVDDPLDAAAVHGFCGVWGVLAVGIFGTAENALKAGYSGADTFSTGEQFAVQIVGVLAIIAWTLLTSSMLFFGLKKTIGVRVSEADEERGLDLAHHLNESEVQQFITKKMHFDNVSGDSEKEAVEMEVA